MPFIEINLAKHETSANVPFSTICINFGTLYFKNVIINIFYFFNLDTNNCKELKFNVVMDSVRSFLKYKPVYLDVETHELSDPPYYDVSVQLVLY